MDPQPTLGRLRLRLYQASASALLLAAAGEGVFVLASVGSPAAEPKSVETLVQMGAALAASLIACAIGFALVWRAARRPAARALSWFLGLFALFWSSVFLASMLDGDAPGAPPYLDTLLELNGTLIFLTVLLSPIAFLRFSALFPRPLTPEDIEGGGVHLRGAAARLVRPVTRPFRWLRLRLLEPRPVWTTALALGSVPLLASAVSALTGFDFSADQQASPLIRAAAAVFAVLVVFFVLVATPALIAISALNLRLSYRLAEADDRRRIRWIVDGFLVGVIALFANPALTSAFDGLGVDHPALDAIPPMIYTIGLLAMVICLAVGVFYDGALDSTLIVRRSAVYTAFGVLLTFLFSGVEDLVSSHVSARLGLPSAASSFVAGGVVALAFGTLRSSVARVAGRKVGGREGEGERGGGREGAGAGAGEAAAAGEGYGPGR